MEGDVARAARSDLISNQSGSSPRDIAAELERHAYGALYRILDKTPTVYVDNDVVEEHAQLFADCRQNGHPLHGKIHTADRWVASCAIAKDFPLLSGDAIFEGVPKLELFD
ncbi:PIN domain-containing protein [Brevibacterium sandarakinum]|uniref:hypothetical protein n=1 Tax=Brevibacterium sandarakinum TaxID=629680 RepID=UPI0018D327FC|nr:hypothetical protein [Brevibacterium sandarakinum]